MKQNNSVHSNQSRATTMQWVWHLIDPRHMPAISSEGLILLVSMVYAAFYNYRFWLAALNERAPTDTGTWLYAGTLFILLTAAHAFLLAFLITRRSAKPVLAILFLFTALAVYYMERYTVFFDTTMLRNVIHTDVKEASELLSWDLLVFVLLYGVLPGVLVLLLKVKQRPWRRALVMRSLFVAGMLGMAAGSVAFIFQDFSALMRNHKEVRYLITPANYVVGLVRVLAADTASVQKKKMPIGMDAELDANAPETRKPTLLVLVIGETARAANWGLNGYARQTTPRLAGLNVVNFPHMTSCGTNTEVSLPCMFSPFGRKDYDETAIRQHESLLHVLERAGFKTVWRDNQSGCKGVCEGLEQQRLDSSNHPTLCDGVRCLDEVLLENFDAELGKRPGNVAIVLHQLGNHGPAYFRRYPPAFRYFTPTCDTAELGKCSREQVVNSYDNALLYTDYFLSRTIEKLQQQASHDAVMIYVSDHGESLGEKGIYLHGLPYAIAPKEQTEVPMVLWLSKRLISSHRLNLDCLKQTAMQRFTHDYLFHSVLGILNVRTQLYDKSYDMTADCRF